MDIKVVVLLGLFVIWMAGTGMTLFASVLKKVFKNDTFFNSLKQKENLNILKLFKMRVYKH